MDGRQALTNRDGVVADALAAVGGHLGEMRGRSLAFEAVLKAHLEREEALLLPVLDT
jgi:hypothetical protein